MGTLIRVENRLLFSSKESLHALEIEENNEISTGVELKEVVSPLRPEKFSCDQCIDLLDTEPGAITVALACIDRLYVIKLYNGNWKYISCSDLKNPRTIENLAASPFIKSEFTALTNLGELLLPNILASSKERNRCCDEGYRKLKPADNSSRYTSVTFCTHPQVFLLAKGPTLQRVDLRERAGCQEQVLSLKDKNHEIGPQCCTEEFSIVERLPAEPFDSYCFGAATSKQVRIYDIRQLGRFPLLQFNHESSEAPKGILQNSTALITWGRKYRNLKCFQLRVHNEYLLENPFCPTSAGLRKFALYQYIPFETPKANASSFRINWWLNCGGNSSIMIDGVSPLNRNTIAFLEAKGDLHVQKFLR